MKESLALGLVVAALHASEAPAAGNDTTIAESQLFAFESDPLINLHHFLYQWTRHEAPRPPRRTGPLIELPEREEIGSLDEGSRELWSRAIAIYAEYALPHDLLFDNAMIDFRDRLAAQGSELQPASDLEGAMLAALLDVMPVYEEHWWPAHDGANRGWVEALEPMLDRHEETLAGAIAGAYGGSWPEDGKIRIDVCAYSNWAKAYTAGNHAVISSTYADHQGAGALEVVFHEASHTPGIGSALRAGIADAFAALDAEVPRDLWHVVMFHTAGHLVERAVADELDAPYVHLATRNGVYQRAPGWSRMIAAVREHWQPWLEGETEREAANAALAAALVTR